MYYFCKVHMTSKKDQEVDTYINLDRSLFNDNETPNLTKEILLSSRQYNEFYTTYKKPKIVNVEYTVYSTEEAVSEDTDDKRFDDILTENKATLIAGSEINIDCARDRLSISKKRKRVPAKKMVIYGLSGAALAFIVFIAGARFGKGGAAVVPVSGSVDEDTTTAEDGMIIPKQPNIPENAQQITVTIDRSYLAVPTEDFQLKGEVVNGVAQITLPEFDRTDYFNHVPGYTWGFSTDPEAEKIEFYSGETYTFKENTRLYRVLVKYGGGSGTRSDPYIINYFDQLELMSEEKVKGYFIQTEDIVFPEWAVHTPIDSVYELGSSNTFVYDGGGYTISGLNNPLFGNVSGALIENVNVRDSNIISSEYQDYAFIVRQSYNYKYNFDDVATDEETTAIERLDDDLTGEEDDVLETGETVIKHCSVSHSAIKVEYPHKDETEEEEQPKVVVNPMMLEEEGEEGEENEDVPETKRAEHCIGAISAVGCQIEDCYVTDFGIYVNIDDYYLYAGGISGSPTNVKNSGVYFFSAKGNIFNAGGIAGSAEGRRMIDQLGHEDGEYYGGNIQGCVSRKIILKTEKSGGGILGIGGSNVKGGAVISNCYSEDLTLSVGTYKDEERTIPIVSGSAGGIIGSDEGTYGHFIMNTVSPIELDLIGQGKSSTYDRSVRTAPEYAYYQQSILNVINVISANPNDPKEIFMGEFQFGSAEVFGTDKGALAYPAPIADLFEKTVVKENSENTEVKNNE